MFISLDHVASTSQRLATRSVTSWVRWNCMYLPKTVHVDSRYKQCLNNGNFFFQNTEFLISKTDTCSMMEFFLFCCSCFGLFSLSTPRGHWFFFHAFRSWGGRESILKHHKDLIFIQKKEKRKKFIGGVMGSIFHFTCQTGSL